MAYKKDRESGAALSGFTEVQRALAEIDNGTAKELRRRLRIVGQDVAEVAGRNVSHKTGRHGPGPRLGGSIKVTVSRGSASVYSTAPHGGAQNVGGRVGRRGATILKRADVSGYMTHAVQSEREHVADELDGLLDWLDKTFKN